MTDLVPGHPHPPASVSRQLVSAPVVRRDSIGPEYHVLTFDVPNAPLPRPGQFLMIRGRDWGEAPLLARPMSYLSGGPTPSILIRVVGEGTRRLGRAVPGDEFILLGPLGTSFAEPTPGRRAVLIAGGVGVAPLLFLARTLAERGLTPLAIYGARSDRDLPLREDLAEVAEVVVTTEDGSLGTRGRVTDVLPEHLGTETEVFTCGPEPMMARVAEYCAERNVPCTVSLEAPMACGFGVCLGCAVPSSDGGYLYACEGGPCVDARRIDWTRVRSLHNPSSSTRSPAS